MMERAAFEALVREGFLAIPEKFRAKVKNVGFIVEDDPSEEVRTAEGLSDKETLFGYYHGIPRTARGDSYGVGYTPPDTIIIYQGPMEDEAEDDSDRLREIVFDTVWHEVGHYLGLDEAEIRALEVKRDRKRG